MQMARRPFQVAVGAAVTTMVSLLVAPPALAAPVPVTPDGFVWQTDGRVDTVAYSADGSVIFLGGLFHTLCPPAAATCSNTTPGAVAVDYLAAVSAVTGAPITSWRPEPDGEVEALRLSTDGTTLYAGGVFGRLAGEVHHRLGALVAASGTARSTWQPNVAAAVKALAMSPDGSALYIGGAFQRVNGTARPLLAVLTAYSAAAPAATLLPWSPAPSGSDTVDKGVLVRATVNSLVVRPDGQVYVGGVFTTIGGLARDNVAAIQPASSTATGAAIAGFALAPSLSYVVLNVQTTRDGTTLFVSGRGPGGFVAAYRSSYGNQLWSRHLDGDVQATVATDTVVYVGGHFDHVSIAGSTLTDLRHHLAAFDATTGATDPWNPAANSVFGVYGLAWSPGHLLAGGDFTKINGAPSAGLAQFTGGDTVPPSSVTLLTATSTVAGRVDLSWSASVDSDSPTLAYQVYRRLVGGSFTLLAVVGGPSAPSGPISFSDTTGRIGTTYNYVVRVADPVFLSGWSNNLLVTVAGA
jgi:hypothetical protein